MRKVLGVDVDLTVVDTGSEWLKWLDRLTGKNFHKLREGNKGCLPYDLSKLYEPFLEDKVDAFDFWRNPHLYDNLQPLENAVEVLGRLSKGGWDIVFVSTVKGFHGKSKYYWLKKHFPFMAGALWTKEKHYARVDAMVDDRNKVLTKMPSDVTCIRMASPYDQDVQMTRPAHEVAGWNEIEEILSR